MVVALAAALGLVQQSGFAAGRYELAERLKRLDVAWMATKDPARRRNAIDLINTATTSFFTSRMSESALALDEAISKLENRRLRPSDALAVRPERPFCEPGATVNLKITWAYRPSSVLPVEVGVGRQTVSVRPGSDATLNVNPWIANPELRQNQETGFLMPVRVGSETRFVYLSFVRKVDERVARLVGSQDPFVSEIGRALDRFQSKPETLETELPLVSYLFSAEAVEDGKAKVGELLEAFLHDTAAFYETRGMPRIAGRLFAYLLVSEPAEQSAAQLAEAVGASRGSVSTMTNLLLRAGLIERRHRRGARHAMFSIAPGAFNRIVASGLDPIRQARQLCDGGLALVADRPPEAQARIRELRDVYAFFERSFPALLDEWEHQRRGTGA